MLAGTYIEIRQNICMCIKGLAVSQTRPKGVPRVYQA